MLAALSTFIALIALAWGLAAAALDAGAGSLPWLLYEQGL